MQVGKAAIDMIEQPSSTKSQNVTIRFEPGTMDELKTYASEKGIGVTTLARMWILERLKVEREK